MSAIIDSNLQAAVQAHTQGDAESCERECRTVLAQSPQVEFARYLLAISLIRLGRVAESVPILKQLSGDPHNSASEGPPVDRRGVELYLSSALRRLGNHSEAVNHARRATEFVADDLEAIGNLGLCLIEVDQLSEAESSFRRLVEKAPQMPFGYHGLTVIEEKRGNVLDAIHHYRLAATKCPPHVPLLLDIADSLKGLDDSPTAEALAELAHSKAPSERTNVLLATCLSERGHADSGLPFAEAAVGLAPDSARAWAVLGIVQQALGDREHSNTSLQRSLSIDAKQGSAWHALVQNGNSNRDIAEQMPQVLATGDLSLSNRCLLRYALARCLEKLECYPESLTAYLAANEDARRLKFGSEHFEAREYRENLNRPLAIVKSSVPPSGFGKAATGPQPIFVFGMIRSGTTLVEQILSMDPDVGAGGEILFWREYWQRALAVNGSELDFARLLDLREEYQQVLSRICPGKPWVVDKMPQNYELAGLLALAFPNAPIIHLTRDPGDNCFSILATANRSRLPFMHDSTAILTAYGAYQELIAGWNDVGLPNMIEVAYEDLVTEQEVWTRRIVEHCGIGWSEEFLHPEANPHQAATPSITQVQSAVYRSSVGRAKPYSHLLGDGWNQLRRQIV